MSSKVTSMNTVEAIRNYLQKIVASYPSIKVLLLDKLTKEIISVVYSFSEILKHDVLLIEMLSSQNREKMPHASCIVFVRPTSENVSLLKEELQQPKYQEYKLFFSNVVSSDSLDRIAASDKKQLVKEIFEYYGDYIAIDKHTFSLNIPTYIPLVKSQFEHPVMDRTCDGIISVILSMKKKPFIRYQKNSDVCKRIAQEISVRMEQEKSLFEFRSNPTLLILDRCDDPITPLLMQWTYQSMIHELLGIHNNRVKISGKNKSTTTTSSFTANEGDKDEKNDFVISASQDSFFAQNMYKNWGDLCLSVKQVVDTFSAKANVKETIASIDDIQKFVSDYPEFKRFAGEVEKHVGMVHDLKTIVSDRNLMDVSQLEQEMVCSDNHTEHLVELKDRISDSSVSKEDALRLVLIYALRYETNPKNETDNLVKLLKEEKEISFEEADIVHDILKIAGVSARNPGLFGETGTIKSLIQQIVTGGIKEETNVFTQHKPLLKRTLEDLFKGKLKENLYPFISRSTKDIPKEVIVFIVGGMTYEESYCVETDFNNMGDRCVILGGTTVLNSQKFISELKQISGGGIGSIGGGESLL